MSASGGDSGGGTLAVLAAAIASSPEAIGIGRGGRVLCCNRAHAHLFGFDDPAEMVGYPVADMVAPESRSVLGHYLEQREAHQEIPRPYRVVAQRRDGTTFDVEVTSTRLQIDGDDCTFAIIHELSRQRRATDALREREEFYRAMFEVNTAIKLLIDPGTGAVIDANPAAADFYGWSLDHLRKMNISDINTLTEAEVHEEMQNARIRRRTSFHFRHRLADGRIRDVDVYSGPAHLRGRTLLLSIIHDVTERNQFEEQLRRNQRLDALGRLAAGIAHDFNNVLTVVMASAQIAERHLPGEARARAYMGDVRHAAQRGAELTRQLLAFARQQALAPRAIDIVESLHRLAGMLQRVLGDEIEVVTAVPVELPTVRFDPGQLELALINLALNARDAMPGGGKIVLRAEVTTEVPAEMVGRERCVLITVEDTGVGMDATTRARVFEPFFTTKAAGQGTGLGLSTVYGVVAQSGGHVAIDSAPGTGTRIHLWVPIDEGRARGADAEAAELAELAVHSVLVVDDREDVREAVARALRDAGIEVAVAGSARGALARLDELRGEIDVVLSDVAMPERSGIDLAADVHGRWPELPVVLMSGEGRASHIEDKPGVTSFIDKPFAMANLLAVLDRAVRR
jgi:PAS domain S-box-containing protein